MNKNKIFLLIFFLLISILSNSLSLTKVNGIDKLSNYQEIKNIEVERIVDYFTVKRRNLRIEFLLMEKINLLLELE